MCHSTCVRHLSSFQLETGLSWCQHVYKSWRPSLGQCRCAKRLFLQLPTIGLYIRAQGAREVAICVPQTCCHSLCVFTSGSASPLTQSPGEESVGHRSEEWDPKMLLVASLSPFGGYFTGGFPWSLSRLFGGEVFFLFLPVIWCFWDCFVACLSTCRKLGNVTLSPAQQEQFCCFWHSPVAVLVSLAITIPSCPCLSREVPKDSSMCVLVHRGLHVSS